MRLGEEADLSLFRSSRTDYIETEASGRMITVPAPIVPVFQAGLH